MIRELALASSIAVRMKSARPAGGGFRRNGRPVGKTAFEQAVERSLWGYDSPAAGDLLVVDVGVPACSESLFERFLEPVELLRRRRGGGQVKDKRGVRTWIGAQECDLIGGDGAISMNSSEVGPS
jgi:hypothetical protein